jgi:cell surface protein SprA
VLLLGCIQSTAFAVELRRFPVYVDSPEVPLPFPIQETQDPTQDQKQSFDLGLPSNINNSVEYDPKSGKYVFKQSIGNNINYRPPSMMTLDEYIKYQQQKELESYWQEKVADDNEKNKPLLRPIKIKSQIFENIFGSNEINIRPQGSVQLSLGINRSRYDNPALPVKQRRMTRFDFQMKMQLNVVGQIGTKLKLTTSYNTEAAFDFENVTKLEYTGDEDEIIQKIELGNVSMPLNTSLIQGSQTLFGAKTRLKFGRLTIDAVASKSRGQRKDINVTGGAQIQKFEVKADEYEMNRHYFLSHYFRDHYDSAMASLPIINSGIKITRIEVWVTNRSNNIENTRNILAFADLGENLQSNIQGNATGFSSNPLPDNSSNNLYNWANTNPNMRNMATAITTLSNQTITPGPFQQSHDFEKLENAKLLTSQDYSYNALLGYISLNLPLNNDEILGVAYQYTYQGQTYQVGNFSTDGVDGQQALFVKLLKPTVYSPQLKVWDLMMKNVYSIGGYQIQKTGFKLDVWYNNPATSLPINFLPYDGVNTKLLVQELEMDKLNPNNQPQPDGVFDFAPIDFGGAYGNEAVNGGTINPKNGRIYLSTIEPFGKTLLNKLTASGMSSQQANAIAFTELYDSTLIQAQQIPSKNRFSIKGEYQSSVSSDIPLNAINVPEGAVSVTAGGVKLVEGVDYTVDYNLGRVKILNDGLLASNTPIKVSVESNSIFGFQQKSLMGAHFNYMINKDFNIGATWMNMKEKPLTQKVDIGSEPFKNNMLGIDINYKTKAPFLTKLVDLLPIISTNAPSLITASAEGAYLIPGTPRGIGKKGISYVDDFEGSQSSIDLTSTNQWHLASIPQGQPGLFPNASLKNDLITGFGRARLNWYIIDPIFYQNNDLTPDHIKKDPKMLEDSRMRIVMQTELFPQLNLQQYTYTNLTTFDLSFYPKERGMYNYDTTNTVDANGDFIDPENRWGGIMRSLSTTNFEQANIEYIQFWVLDPFNADQLTAHPGSSSGGDLYFNLGNISEDILPDSRRSYENGLPPTSDASQSNLDTTNWSRLSANQVTVNAFANDPSSRVLQDVGLDGWNDEDEKKAYQSYINWVNANSTLNQDGKNKLISDVSSDNFNYYLDDNYDTQELDIIARYRKYNGLQGNSPTREMTDTMNTKKYVAQAYQNPDVEDINGDNNLSETESYFQYKVSLRPNDMVVGKNFITDYTEVTTPTGKKEKWYQFKVPIRSAQKAVNGITDFRSIRFMRMFLMGWNDQIVLRFGKLDLIRGEWRKYRENLANFGEGLVTDPNSTVFNINAVNIEQNSDREPINYVMPPGIQREIDPGQPQLRQLNEQALSMQVCGLEDGDARAGYRNVSFNLNNYKKLKMFVHGEMSDIDKPIKDNDLVVFVRLGSDFTDNYYEYELPLKLTAWGSTSADEIWPENNNVEIVFDHLTDLKKKRNAAIASGDPSVSAQYEYTQPDPDDPNRILKVKGSPNLQGLKTIMIGIRNPSKTGNSPWKATDDGLAKCAEVWVNELRLTDFDTKGGGAAVAKVQMQLADFGTISLAGNYSGLNWGDIDSRVQERQRNVKMGLNFNTSLQLGQFFGKKARISLPFFYSYSVNVINPEFDPFNPDITLRSYDLNERKEKARLGQDLIQQKSYNFTNVRHERAAGKKAHFWDLANFSLNYGYNENMHRDFNTKYDRTKVWTGGINYAFSNDPFYWQPFKNIKFMKKSKWWAIIRDAGWYLGPKNFSVTNNLVRSYNERQVRNNLSTFEFAPVYVKNFTWARAYTFKYDLTKNLKFDLTANNNSIFAEPEGMIDRKNDPDNYKLFKDSIFRQLRTGGKAMNYSHTYNLSYNLPFNLIPAFDWMSSNIRYTGGYSWQRAPLGQTSFGNIIQNNRNLNITAQLNFTNLYNKIPFFKKINTGTNSRGKVGGNLRKSAVNLKNPLDLKIDSTMTDRQKEKIRKKKERERKKADRAKKPVNPVLGFLGRLIMTVRNVSGTYSVNDGIMLPGYNQGVSLFGFNGKFSAPNVGFIFGQQPTNIWGRSNGNDFAREAADKGFLVKNSRLNTQHTVSHSQTYSFTATLEPIKDLRINLTMNRNYTANSSEYFRWNDSTAMYEGQSRFDVSNLSYSTISIGSAFSGMDKKDFTSKVFTKLRDNRSEVSRTLGKDNPNSSSLSDGYFSGYGEGQQDVLIGAFLAAYTGGSSSKKGIANPIKSMPLPNWNITYDGLSKLKFMKKIVQNFILKHSYTSSVNVSGMKTNLDAVIVDGHPTAVNSKNDFISSRQIQNVAISESFSPLIGFDATWRVAKNGLITKFEVNKNRTVTLATTNNQVTEMLGSEVVVGAGYKFGNVKLPFKIRGRQIKSDLIFRFDLSIRDNTTVIRKIIENTSQATAGQNVISIRSTFDYNLGQNITLQLYYDQMITKPKIATAYPTGNLNCGFRLRINLGGLSGN